MSIFKLKNTDYQQITVTTNPSRFYSSSSAGTVGSVYLYARRSDIEKEISPAENFTRRSFGDADLQGDISVIQTKVSQGQSATSQVNAYLNKVKNQRKSVKKDKKLEIYRFVPTPVSGTKPSSTTSGEYPTKNYLRKVVVRENLSKHYRGAYPSVDWGYCNYHSINFFTSSTVSPAAALLYPNYDNQNITHDGYVSGTYTPSGSFSFDFYINPRYKKLDDKGHFNAGTIFHLHKVYALSLVTGSKKDENGLPIGFRLMLQLSHSAGVSPNLSLPGSFPNNLTFLSDDNSLSWNTWHHAVVRWGTDTLNQGTGSFNIDGTDRGTFVVPSGTIAPRVYASENNPDVLCIGNYLSVSNSGVNAHKLFFSRAAVNSCGVYELDSSLSDPPPVASFLNPLQAEVHDLSIKRYYVSDSDIALSGSTGPSSIDQAGLAFFLPPFFVENSTVRGLRNAHGGGVPLTVTKASRGSETTPFNLHLGFGVDGHFINIENFLKDFATNNFPVIRGFNNALPWDSTTLGEPIGDANSTIYSNQSIRKRNLTILPCDDGDFYPDYSLLENEPKKRFYVDDMGSPALGYINLSNMMSVTSSLLGSSNTIISDAVLKQNIKIRPEKPVGDGSDVSSATSGPTFYSYYSQQLSAPSGSPTTYFQNLQESAPLTTIQQTRDSSSNQVTFFDISNLYYGMRILPKSFMIKDNSLTGSGGAINITIKDDGNGTLYRADALSNHSTWNAVGTIFYDEGIVVIKNPHLYFFGKDGYEMSFKGEQNVHVLRYDLVAPANHLNSSSNPSYDDVPSTLRPNEYDSKFVYITGINFHDDNMNVVMKTQLAQPIMKRHSDKIAFKVKYDF